jgi:predicted O-linked N-acetylglucosamine transferase (SPINDLY family)
MNQVAPSTRKLMKIAEAAIAKGRGQEAWDALQQVLRINPNHAEALYQSGFMLHSAGEYAQAEQFYRRVTYADPSHIQSYHELLQIFDVQNRGDEAMALADHMTKLMPENPDAHAEMTAQMLRYNHAHMVPEYSERILARFPTHLNLLQNYILALKINRRYEEADTLYLESRKKLRFPLYFRLAYEFYLPRSYNSVEEIDYFREKFKSSAEALLKEKPRLPIINYMLQPLFQLAYHNRDNKELVTLYSRMLRTIAPELNYVAPHCRGTAPRQEGPLRIGFVSKHMYAHSVGSCYRGVMIYLAEQPDIVVTFFNLSNVMDDKMQLILDSKVEVISLPKAIEAAQETIAQFKLDMLIYPDIGMDAMTYYLAMARLAPHQLVLQGHPETTGIDTMDYFVSSRHYEPADGQENYTEKLICIPGMDTLFKRATPPQRWLSRNDLGLPEGKKLYICPMAIQKFHPDFDDVLADILTRDNDAVVVLFSDFQQQNTSDLLRERILRKADGSRVIFLPWLPLEVLFSVLKTADALLDTFYFGGGTTIQYAFSFGLPIVSMPSHYARGRMVHAYYGVLGIEGSLAKTPQEYVRLAIKLAHDADYRKGLEEQILANNHKMFDMNHCGDDMVGLVRAVVNGDVTAYLPA